MFFETNIASQKATASGSTNFVLEEAVNLAKGEGHSFILFAEKYDLYIIEL